MPTPLAERAQQWDLRYVDQPSPAELNDAGERIYFNGVLKQIEYFAERRFAEYAPTATGPFPTFMERLEQWVDQAVTEDDQKAFLRLVQHVFFIGAQEFAALYRSAYNGVVIRWIIDQLGLRLDDRSIAERVAKAIQATWFCPITDSMQIAAFCHVNRITSFDLRPDWKSMAALGSVRGIRSYMRKKSIERLVLMEDFVGSGTQMFSAVKFAAEKLWGTPILLCPLIIANRGLARARDMRVRYPNLTVSPVLTLPDTAAVTQILTKGCPRLFDTFRTLASKYCPAVSDGGASVTSRNPNGPLGFNCTGGLVVMYSNCPNNTLPLLHHEGANWKPLFPRSARV